eukprot:3395173-Prorocentrum_lima.AAC.1
MALEDITNLAQAARHWALVWTHQNDEQACVALAEHISTLESWIRQFNLFSSPLSENHVRAYECN